MWAAGLPHGSHPDVLEHLHAARSGLALGTGQEPAGDEVEVAVLVEVQPPAAEVDPRRGLIQGVDRAGLIRRSCECYAAFERHFSGILGTSGSGSGDSGGCD